MGSVFGQVGVGTTTPDESSILEIYSGEKGLLIPRMPRNARDNIKDPAEGLLIYQTNSVEGFYHYDGVSWVPIKPDGRLISKVSSASSGEVLVEYTDGTSALFPSLKGIKGNTGLSFAVKYLGYPSDRSTYDNLPKGESFLDIANGLLYFRTGLSSPDDWSAGILFGKGDKGETGDRGVQGARGLRGPKGSTGYKGERGFTGYSLSPSKIGLFKDRDLYITSTVPLFSYLAVDKGELYILEKPGVWSPAIPFGKGEKGDKGDKGIKGGRGSKGLKGKVGLSFDSFVTGLFAGRSLHDSKPVGFSYLASDRGKIYFRETGVSGWSKGQLFGKGDRGDPFGIDQFGLNADRFKYNSEDIGFTYYSTDIQQVFYKNHAGWSVGIPLVSLPGRTFTIDKQGALGDRGTYDTRHDGFVYYAEGDGKTYFKKPGGAFTGWTAGTNFRHRGQHFGIDDRGGFSSRSVHDNKNAGFTYYADDRGKVYVREGLPGNWSAGSFFGVNLGTVNKAQVVVGNDLDYPESRDLTGDFRISELGVIKLELQTLEDKHFKDLTASTISGRNGILFLWDETLKKWEHVDVKSLHKYDLLKDWGLYYDDVNDYLGRGTNTPSAFFDVKDDLASNDLLVRNTLTVKRGAIFNEVQGAHDFLVKSDGDPDILFVQGSSNRVGIGTVTPKSMVDVDGIAYADKLGVGVAVPLATLDVRGKSFFNDGAGDKDFRVKGQADAQLFFVDASTDHLGIGTETPQAKLDVRGTVVFNEAAADFDFRVEGDNAVNLLFTDAANNRVGIGTGLPLERLDVRGSSIFNSGAGDHDLRIVGQSEPNVLYVDASTNRVGLGTNLPIAMLDVRGTAMFNTGRAVGNTFRVMAAKRTISDPSVALLFVDVDNHRVAIGTSTPSGAMFEVFKDAVFNSEGGDYDFRVQGENVDTLLFVNAGTDRVGIGTGVPNASLGVAKNAVFNSEGGDNDFRIQGDTEEDLLFVDASTDRVGVGTSVPLSTVHVTHATDVGMILGKSTGVAGNNHMWFGNPTGTPIRVGTWRGVGTGVQDGLLIQTSNVALGNAREVAYFGADGRVGIGSTSPMSALHIVDTTGVGVILDKSTTVAGNNDMWFANPLGTPMNIGTWRGVGTEVQDGLLVQASNAAFGNVSEVAYFGANGRMGIGTNAPVKSLHVVHATDVGMIVGRSTAVAGDKKNNYMWFDNPTGTPMRVGTWRGVGTGVQDGLLVQTSDGNLDRVREVIYFGANGRVGIGTTSPTETFDVRGGAVFNADMQDKDFRIEGENVDTLFFVDASTNRVGIGTNVPSASLDVATDALFNSEGGAGNDFRVRGDHIDTVFFVDASTDRVGIETSVPSAMLDVVNKSEFNTDGADNDFRVQGENVDALFFVDASTDRVGIGTRVPSAMLDVRGATVFNQNNGSNNFSYSGFADDDILATNGATNRVGIGTNSPSAKLEIEHAAVVGLRLTKTGTTTGTNMIWFSGTTPMRIGTRRVGTNAAHHGFVINASDASYDFVRDFVYLGADGRVGFGATGITNPEAGFVVSGGAVFNQTGVNHDFRVEGDGETHMLFTDASQDRVGIGTSTPSSTLHVHGTSSRVMVIDHSGTGNANPLWIGANTGRTPMVIGANATGLFINSSNAARTGVRRLFTVTSGGRVGIGTNAPSMRLHVAGGASSTGTNGSITSYSYTFATSSAFANLINPYTGVAQGTHKYAPWPQSYNTDNGYWSRFVLPGKPGNSVVGKDFTYPVGTNGIGRYKRLDDAVRLAAIFEGSVLIHQGSLVMVATNFTRTYSDRRIKKDVETMEVDKSLNTLGKIRMVSYKYRDTLQQGQGRFDGVLAQELEKVAPSYVKYTTEYVPGIYRNGKVISYDAGVLELEVYNTVSDTEAVPGDEVRIYVSGNDLKETKLAVKLLSKKMLRGNTSLRFKVPLKGSEEIVWDDLKEAFIFGKKVDDFRTVAYGKIHTLNVAVTQHLMEEMDAVKKTAGAHKEQLIHLEREDEKREVFNENMLRRMQIARQALEKLK